jgi:AraC-like DNA-binding protein
MKHFSVSARMFHSGPLCGINDFEPPKGMGQLHLLQRGKLQIEHHKTGLITVTEPSLLFYPRPFFHRFITDDKKGPSMVCAYIQFNEVSNHPLVQSISDFLILPLSELTDTGVILDILFREAFNQQCGRQVVVDRLFEVVFINILRWLMDHNQVSHGVLAGMAHPQIARTLVAMHTQPANDWSLEKLSKEAGMSRSVYAAAFKKTLDTTPLEYLATWRLSLAQQKLLADQPIKKIVEELGYGSVEAFSRAFKTRCNIAPKQWKAQNAN